MKEESGILWGTRYALLGVGLIFIFLAIASLPLAFLGSGEELGWGFVAYAQVCTGLAFIFIPYFLVKRKGGTWSDLGLRSFDWSKALLWMSLSLFIYLLFLGLYALFFPETEQAPIQDSFGPLFLQIFFIVLLAPISEEVCFRGFLFRGLRSNIPFLPAALLSGLVFGLLHLSGGVGTIPAITFLGALFALLYEKTNSIWPAILLHTANNAFVLGVLTLS